MLIIAKKTTLKKLMKNKCYCTRKDEDISLKDCKLFDCGRWKKCMKKSNNDIDKDLKRQARRQKNGEMS